MLLVGGGDEQPDRARGIADDAVAISIFLARVPRSRLIAIQPASTITQPGWWPITVVSTDSATFSGVDAMLAITGRRIDAGPYLGDAIFRRSADSAVGVEPTLTRDRAGPPRRARPHAPRGGAPARPAGAALRAYYRGTAGMRQHAFSFAPPSCRVRPISISTASGCTPERCPSESISSSLRTDLLATTARAATTETTSSVSAATAAERQPRSSLPGERDGIEMPEKNRRKNCSASSGSRR